MLGKGGISVLQTAIFFLTIDANGVFWAHFLVEFVLTPPPIVCDVCIQNSDLPYTGCGRIFTSAVEDHIKQKRIVFILSQ